MWLFGFFAEHRTMWTILSKHFAGNIPNTNPFFGSNLWKRTSMKHDKAQEMAE
jgi:hypothetical protein